MYTKEDKLFEQINDLHDDLTKKLNVKHNIDLEFSNILDLTYIVIDNDILNDDDINIIYYSIEQTLIRKYNTNDIPAVLHVLTSISFINAKIEQLAAKEELFEIASNACKLGILLEQLTQDIISNGTQKLLNMNA